MNMNYEASAQLLLSVMSRNINVRLQKAVTTPYDNSVTHPLSKHCVSIFGCTIVDTARFDRPPVALQVMRFKKPPEAKNIIPQHHDRLLDHDRCPHYLSKSRSLSAPSEWAHHSVDQLAQRKP